MNEWFTNSMALNTTNAAFISTSNTTILASDSFKMFADLMKEVPVVDGDCPSCGYKSWFHTMPPPDEPFRCWECGTEL